MSDYAPILPHRTSRAGRRRSPLRRAATAPWHRAGRSWDGLALRIRAQFRQRFRRVDVAQARFARFDLAHELLVAGEQRLRAQIAGDFFDLGEELPRPKHRVAALALMRGDADRPSICRRE